MENGQERRSSKRKIVQIKAEVLCSGKSYKGFIENISANGIYFLTSPTDSSDYSCGKEVELRLLDSDGNPLQLKCKVTWHYKTPPHGLTLSSGLDIISPPDEFTTFYEHL